MFSNKTPDLTKWVEKEINQLQGSTLRLALLLIIRKNQPSGGIYGYAIGEELSSITEGELDGTNATFYAILRRLENDDLVTSKLKISPKGPARKYYFLTEKGELACNALWENWIHYFGLLRRLFE